MNGMEGKAKVYSGLYEAVIAKFRAEEYDEHKIVPDNDVDDTVPPEDKGMT